MKASQPLDCIVAGEANADLLVGEIRKLEFNKEKLIQDASLVLGGSSSITAFNLACLGARVGFAGIVGDDIFGRFVEEKLALAGIDLTHLRKHHKVKSGLTIWLSNGASRAGVTYPGTIAMLRAGDVPDEYLAHARHLHVGAYFFQTNLQRGAAGLFQRAHRLGLTTSLDCNYDPLEMWDSGILKVLRHTDVFFPNTVEALRIAGVRNLRSAATALAGIARAVVVKCGADGVLVAANGEIVSYPALKAKVVDTTGAGDSFNAGFLSQFSQGGSLEASVKAGLAAGARSVSHVGGTGAFEALLRRRRAVRTSV